MHALCFLFLDLLVDQSCGSFSKTLNSAACPPTKSGSFWGPGQMADQTFDVGSAMSQAQETVRLTLSVGRLGIDSLWMTIPPFQPSWWLTISWVLPSVTAYESSPGIQPIVAGVESRLCPKVNKKQTFETWTRLYPAPAHLSTSSICGLTVDGGRILREKRFLGSMRDE